MKFFEEINQAGFSFLNKLEEPRSNSLSIQVGTAKISDVEEDLIISEKNLGPVRSVFTDDTCEQYEILFERYVSYHVLNETYSGNDGNDKFIGTYFRIYSKSAYLDYIENNTGVFVYDNEKLKHYAVILQHHLIDIISVKDPTVTRIN